MDWGLVRHPLDDGLWFMPTGLIQDELKERAKRKQQQQEKDEHVDEEWEDTGGSVYVTVPNKTRVQTLSPLRPIFRLINRFALHEDLSSSLSNASSKTNRRLGRLSPYHWKTPGGLFKPSDEKHLVWREDMPGFVLQNMRKAAVKALKKACTKGKKLETTDGVWRVVDVGFGGGKGLEEGLKKVTELDRMSWGAVLVMERTTRMEAKEDEGKTEEQRNFDHASAASDDPSIPSPTPARSSSSHLLISSSLPDLITLPTQGTKVPVFDLTTLLSEKDLEELRQHHPRFKQGALFFRPGGYVPVDAMLVLWKLKGYTIYDQE
jgi:hypothetical protein